MLHTSIALFQVWYTCFLTLADDLERFPVRGSAAYCSIKQVYIDYMFCFTAMLLWSAADERKRLMVLYIYIYICMGCFLVTCSIITNQPGRHRLAREREINNICSPYIRGGGFDTLVGLI